MIRLTRAGRQPAETVHLDRRGKSQKEERTMKYTREQILQWLKDEMCL